MPGTVEYVAFRHWVDDVHRPSSAGATPLVQAILKEEGWKLPSTTREDIRQLKENANDELSRQWFARQEQLKQDTALKNSHKQADDIKAWAQFEDNCLRRSNVLRKADRQAMIEDIAAEKDLEERSKTFSSSLFSHRSVCDDRASRRIAHADEVIGRRKVDCLLMEAAEKSRDRAQAKAEMAEAIKKQCRRHRRCPPRSPHTARRLTYFKFGAEGTSDGHGFVNDLRHIQDFNVKWKLEPTRSTMLLAKLEPEKRRHVMNHFCSTETGSAGVDVLDIFITELNANRKDKSLNKEEHSGHRSSFLARIKSR
jgi:hypothetical protein